MEKPNQRELRQVEPWWMALMLFGLTVATAVGALVVGFVLGWLNEDGMTRNSWGGRGETTFYVALWVWLVGWAIMALVLLAKRRYASFTGTLLGGALTVYLYLSWPWY